MSRSVVATVSDQVARRNEQRLHKSERAPELSRNAYISPMRPQDILMPTAEGLFCRPGGFHIDPVRPVDKALITHGHSDHARAGHGNVLATRQTLDIMRIRYGDDFAGTEQA